MEFTEAYKQTGPCCFSPDARFLAVAVDYRLVVRDVVSLKVHPPSVPHLLSPLRSQGSRDCKDYINLLSCHSWEIMSAFAVDTVDLAGVEWSPDDSAIVVWDSLLEYKVLIYSPDGRCLFKYLAYESGLGVKSVAWSPCGQFLAVGSYDQAVRTLNHLTWKTFAEFTHAASIRSPCNAAIFKEVDDPWQLDMSELCLSEGFSRNMQDNGAENGTEGGGSRVKYAVMDVPITLPSTKPATDKPNPKQGIG
ncbi:WD repeat-containing protein WRAP73, partial [Dichanthelium oligosanthes]